MEKRLELLEKKMEDQARILHDIIALGGRDMVNKAGELAQIKTTPYQTQEIEEEELLKEIGNKRLETRQKLSKRTARRVQTDYRGK